jgi:hypothetical protein
MPYTIMSDLPAYSPTPLPAKPKPCIIILPRSSTDPYLPEYYSAMSVHPTTQYTSNRLYDRRPWAYSIRTWYQRNKHRMRILAWSIVAIAALSVTFYYSRRHNLQQMAEREKAHQATT